MYIYRRFEEHFKSYKQNEYSKCTEEKKNEWKSVNGKERFFLIIRRQQMFHKFDKKKSYSHFLCCYFYNCLNWCYTTDATASVVSCCCGFRFCYHKQHSINVMRAHSFKRFFFSLSRQIIVLRRTWLRNSIYYVYLRFSETIAGSRMYTEYGTH